MERGLTERMERECRKAWEKAGRGRMLLGVSGGADSTALLTAFQNARIPFDAAHCNFNLRGEESVRDKEFVKKLCGEKKIRLHTVDFDTEKETMKGESTEMACRRLRYEYFLRLKEKEGYSRIAVAHNACDNEETFLLNMLRGSGTRGLKGMEEDNGTILRPLLWFGRKEILSYLEAMDQDHITDSSNLESDRYRRNFLRNKIIPMLEEKWEGVHKAIASTIEYQRRENKIVEHYISKALEGADTLLPWETLREFPDAETLIYRFIEKEGGTSVTAKEMAGSAVKEPPGKEWTLPSGKKAVFTRQGIRIEGAESEENPRKTSYRWTKIANPGPDEIKKAPLTEIYLPIGEEAYEWRAARKGMRIKSLGLAGSQDVVKVLKDARLTARERQDVEVLTEKETGEPIWIPGLKRARVHLVSPEAETVYKVTVGSE